MMMPPVPWIGVKTMCRSLRGADHRAIEDERFQALHVGVVDSVAEA